MRTMIGGGIAQIMRMKSNTSNMNQVDRERPLINIINVARQGLEEESKRVPIINGSRAIEGEKEQIQNQVFDKN